MWLFRLLIASSYFCSAAQNVVFPTSSLSINPFDREDSRLNDFELMCSNIGKIVKEKNISCFISYAWPSEQSPLNSWVENIVHYLTLAGLHIIFDKTHFTGRVHELHERLAESSRVLVLLTPDYRFKCLQGRPLAEEAIGVFNKPSYMRRFVTLAGRIENSIPEDIARGHYTPGNEMIHMMTNAPYESRGDHDTPSMNGFFKVMCNLLDCAKEWGLLFALGADYKNVCTDHLVRFKQRHLDQQFNQDKETPRKDPSTSNPSGFSLEQGAFHLHIASINVTKGVAVQVVSGDSNLTFN